ncbi:hypothetical protein [Propionivibrio sp.]|uniref:hypothetical protein n=1 Tax=Propionivibrio sp. TaxID=2212460 RepID=UPI003BF04BA6
MNKLNTELQRLYALHGQQLDDSAESSPDGKARAMVVDFERAADWEQAAKLYLAVQNDLNLPAPAVSVSGLKGYGVWFSLEEPVPVAQARIFLNALRLSYLVDIPAANIGLRPDAYEPAPAIQAVTNLPPSLNILNGKWSAFIDPSLGSMFIDEPWLEMSPNMAKQAGILAGLESINTEDFQKALILLQTQATADTHPGLPPVASSAAIQNQSSTLCGSGAGRYELTLNAGKDYSDPESFLLAVMNDPTASAGHRIAAAKALLPYFPKKII